MSAASSCRVVFSQEKDVACRRALSPYFSRSGASESRFSTCAVICADVVGEQPGLVVDDRLGDAPGEREGHRRRAVQARLDDGEAPTLLVRRHEDDPRLREEGALGVLVDEAVEAHRSVTPRAVAWAWSSSLQ